MNKDEDLMRMPDSSSDDEASEQAFTNVPDTSLARASPPLKRKRSEPTRPTRKSERKRVQIETVDSKADIPIETPQSRKLADIPASQDEFEMLSSQPLSQRPKFNTYGGAGRRIKKHENPEPELTKAEPRSLAVHVAEQSNGDEKLLPKPQLDTSPLEEHKEERPKPSLQLFGNMDNTSYFQSSASSTTLDSKLIDLMSSPGAARPRRSHSIFSLSSPPPDNECLPSGKASAGTPIPMCPNCKKTIDMSFLPTLNKGRGLTIRAQQAICQAHRFEDAKSFAKTHGYPDINWDDIERTRIPLLMTHLRQVLQREAGSYYQYQLDMQIAKAKGNRKSLQNYFYTGVLEVAKPGYYGPKGEKISVHAIAQALTKELKLAAKKNDAVRQAGVGPYVAAVLVPECLTKLVMQDMKVGSQERARDILAESADVGLLLNPDDDSIELYEEL